MRKRSPWAASPQQGRLRSAPQVAEGTGVCPHAYVLSLDAMDASRRKSPREQACGCQGGGERRKDGLGVGG